MIAKKKMCKIWEHVPKRGGGSRSFPNSFGTFCEGVWQNVTNPKLKMCFILASKRLNYPLICVKTTILRKLPP